MNSLLETLNVWADHALGFAWPMLWQSSLLIGVLFALDLLLRRKLRPAVRYALWLVVVVKVLLPPSLAFPTGPSWWLRPAKMDAQFGRASVPASPDFWGDGADQGSRGRSPSRLSVLSSAPDEPVLPSGVTLALAAPSQPRLTLAAWIFVGMVAVSLGLFAWMLARWYQVACDARRAAPAPAWIGELLPERQRPARIRLIDRPQSPAVCGLFRPVILLPRSLADHLQPAQLRAVLLHELVHLRRGDVWVNCLQTLVQILYWWHPLLWLANARIRRVREEAVDDAVMLALKEESEAYAPTLLQVAKLSLSRPLASLGLVGILESRSSLRQRIERLLDFRPPRRAGLTLGSALAVVGFAAVAVPMGEAPPSAAGAGLPASGALVPGSAANDPASPRSTAESEEFVTRSFRVDPNTLVEGLHLAKRPMGTNGWAEAWQALTRYLEQAGVDLDPVRNPGKVLFFSHGSGALMVRGTAQDLGRVERAIEALKAPPVRVTVRGLRSSTNVTLTQLFASPLLGPVFELKGSADAGPERKAGVLTQRQLNPLISAFEQARLSTVYGSVETRGAHPAEIALNNGQSVSVTPIVFEDGETIRLVVSTLLEEPVEKKTSQPESSLKPKTEPGAHLRRTITVATIYDGQAVLLGDYTGRKEAEAGGRGVEEAFLIRAHVAYPSTNEVSRPLRETVPPQGLTTMPPGPQAKTENADEITGVATKVKASTLVHDGKLLYEMGKLDEAEAKLKAAVSRDPGNEAASYYLNLVAEARFTQGNPWARRESLPILTPYSRTNLVYTGQGRPAILSRLDRIRLDKVSFDRLPLGEVVRFLVDESKKRDPEDRGVNFLILTATDGVEDLSSLPITINPPLTNIRLADVLDAVAKVAGRPIKYSIAEYAVVFSARSGQEPPPLYVRTFKVSEDTLMDGLHVPRGPVGTNGLGTVLQALLDHLSEAGVDLEPHRNPGKAFFYSDRSGMLMVRATLQDLDTIERKIAALGRPSKQEADAGTLVHDGKLLYQMGKLDEADAKLKAAVRKEPHNKAALYYLNLVSEAKVARAAKSHDVTTIQRDIRAVEQAWANPLSRELLPTPNPYARTNLAYTGQGRQAIMTKLDRIRLERVSFDGLPLGEVVSFLNDECKKRDPEKRGINFLINQNIAGGAGIPTLPKLGPGGYPLPTAPPEQVDMISIAIKINPALTDIRLADVLDAIVKVADRPIKYSIEDYAVVFSLKVREAPPLYVRTFKVDPNTLFEGLHLPKGAAEANGSEAVTRALRDALAREGVDLARALRDALARAGVDLDSTKNPGKSLFYNERQGMLLVRATMQDLDIVEALIQILNTPPEQDPDHDHSTDWLLGTNSLRAGRILQLKPPTTETWTAGYATNAVQQAEEYSAQGLELECHPTGTNVLVGQSMTMRCIVTNASDGVRRIGADPIRLHFWCIQNKDSWMGEIRVLPEVSPLIRPPVRAEQFAIVLPPHTALELMVSLKGEHPGKVRYILVYDPSLHGGGFFGSDAVDKAMRACIYSDPFEYEVTAPSRTVLTADQAGLLAQQLANEKAQELYFCRPFRDGPPAQLAQGHWEWHRLQALGQTDMEATVEFAVNGREPKVTVVRLESRLTPRTPEGDSPQRSR